jgi:hypothetical protein
MDARPFFLVLALGLGGTCARARTAQVDVIDAEAVATIEIARLSPTLSITFWASPLPPSGAAGVGWLPRSGEVEVVGVAEETARVLTLRLPWTRGNIEYFLVDRAYPRRRWLYVIEDYACARGGHLKVVVEASPRGDRWIRFESRYAGDGCRAPVTPLCCSNSPNAPGDE